MAFGEENSALAPVFDGNIKSLPNLQIQGYSKDRFIQEMAMRLFANIDFKSSVISIEALAKQCVERSKILAYELGL